MLLLDIFVFLLLGLYLDKIIPSDFGQRYSPYFCVQPSYYRCCRRERRRGADSFVDDDKSRKILEEGYDDEFESAQMPPNNYEAPPVMCKRLEVTNDYLKIDSL